MAALSAGDPNSFSNPEDCIVTHIDLHLDVDFTDQVLRGTVDLTVEKKTDAAEYLILDTRDVKVYQVTDKSGQVLQFTLGEPVLSFGSKLEIKLPAADKSCVITVKYETSPCCTALQWLKPDQTKGKRQPYLFSQCQVSAPKAIVVLMSALRSEPVPNSEDPSRLVHSFQQSVPVPSYLIAIVGGDLESRDIGPRSKVWSEKEMVDEAAYEFAETEYMLKTAESLMGPYVWGQYDLLVLPPSFPYGGMENPCLTFVTPTLLAGDRSLADVVAHEISHSWTGNLVTNSNAEHFWLNEGHTRCVERKIVARMKSGESYRQFLSFGGWLTLQETVSVLGEKGPYTKLVPDLKGVDPDDAFSAVPYEKGSTLLLYLETLLGGPAEFEPFLRAYIEKFKYQSIKTEDWKNFLYSFFSKPDQQAALNSVDWDKWFYGVGMPPVKPDYDTSMSVVCESLAQRWVEATEDSLSQFSSEDVNSLLSVQVQQFLGLLLTKDPLPVYKVQKMDKIYKFTSSETRFRWLRLCIRAQWEDIIPRAIEMVTEQGRMKFTRPLYRDLYAWDKSREKAVANFHDKRAEMHSLTASLVAKDMKLDS